MASCPPAGPEILGPWPFPEIALPPWIMVVGTYPENRSPNGRNTVAVLLEESAGKILRHPDTWALTQFALHFTAATPWRQSLLSCCDYDEAQAERLANMLLQERQFRDTLRGLR